MRTSRGLLVTHGGVGRALLDAAARIYGLTEGLTALSNDGIAPEEMRRCIAEWVASGTTHELHVLLVDLQGGSCGTVAQMMARAQPNVAVVAGVNLAMVLEFLQSCATRPPEELLQRLENRGRAAVLVLSSPFAKLSS